MCAGGGGKTTRIIAPASANTESRALLVTYTRNNERWSRSLPGCSMSKSRWDRH
jgi:hypothetical protein